LEHVTGKLLGVDMEELEQVVKELNNQVPKYHLDLHGVIYREDPKTRQLEQEEGGTK